MKWILMALILFGLVACTHNEQKLIVVQPPTLEQVQETYRQTLAQQGIVVFDIGEIRKIIIPSDVIFAGSSANLWGDQGNKLDLVAKYMASYEDPVVVWVAAFTDNCGPPPLACALTERQAQIVAHYLWDKGIDTRILMRAGYGSNYPVATNYLPEGHYYNRRVEITFRVYPVQSNNF